VDPLNPLSCGGFRAVFGMKLFLNLPRKSDENLDFFFQTRTSDFSAKKPGVFRGCRSGNLSGNSGENLNFFFRNEKFKNRSKNRGSFSFSGKLKKK
jgi:hypothetical protein